MQSFLVSAAVLICFYLFFPAAIFAASHSVVPLVIDHELQKRDIIQEIITLTNNSNGVVRVYPTVNEISIGSGGDIQTFIEPSMTDRTTSITSWLEIGRGRIELQPNQTLEVPLTIKVNPDVVAGEYHAFVGFPQGSNRPDAEKKVTLGNAPGTIVRIEVDKEQDQFLRLEQFSVERLIKNAAEGKIEYTLSNPGDSAVTPKGEIIFYDTNGTEVAAIAINTDGTVIEGGDEVTLTESVPSTVGMGKRKAFLSVEYGEHQTASVHDTAFFYVLPIKYIVIIFVIVLVLAILIALYVHRKFDVAVEDDGVNDVAVYIRQGRSESKEHDIDLSKKNTD